LRERLRQIEQALEELLGAGDVDAAGVERARVRLLGRKGEWTALARELSALPAAERPAAGAALNDTRRRIEERLAAATAAAAVRDASRAVAARLDVSLPGRRGFVGTLHPVTRARRDLERIFRDLGFRVESGPEVEDDFHNFQALNIPPGHPARENQDTFYLDGGLLLRTHTSPVQIRTLERQPPPIRMICPGRVYRRDHDATHLPMFHQLEALVVDCDVSMADLKGTLAAVWHQFFGADVGIRLRPGYFPFVEPGCEYDIACRVCDGRGCRVCKETGWIELGGAGMVHPAVFEAVGLDPERYTGFAFGLGLDRIAMMRHGIDDLRLMIESDVRFLAQFPGA